jgi:hypothetical protein
MTVDISKQARDTGLDYRYKHFVKLGAHYVHCSRVCCQSVVVELKRAREAHGLDVSLGTFNHIA